MAKEDGSNAKSHCGGIDGSGAESCPGFVARTCDTAIRGFICGGEWSSRTASSRFVISRFTHDSSARSVAGCLCEGAGGCVYGNNHLNQGEATGRGAQRGRHFPPQVSLGAGPAAELECR